MVKPLSIRAKLLAILLGLFAILAGAFAAYAHTTSVRYRELRTEEMAETVAFEAERVAGVIAEMDRNAIDLAQAGRRYYDMVPPDPEFGEAIVIQNISSFPNVVGGGIWYEPFAISTQQRRVAHYAYRDESTGSVDVDPQYASLGYDYLSQMWYQTIHEVLDDFPHGGVRPGQDSGMPVTVWTVPYFDDAGTNVLMTTVGAGIYDDFGKLVGMATADWEVSSMVERLTTVRPTAGSVVLLTSITDDQIIADTKKSDNAGHPFSDFSWADELAGLSDTEVRQSYVTQDGIDYLTFSRLFDNGWLFSVHVPENEMFADIDAMNMHYAIALGAALAAGIAAAWILMSKLVSRPLSSLSSQVVALGAAGDLDAHIPVSSRDEIGKLALAFNKMTNDLKRLIGQRITALAEKERIGTELSVAHDIQAAILPHTFPAFPNRDEFDIYACMYPQREIGGDFYDFFLVDDTTLAVVIADVSGKGVPAALFMMGARTMIRNAILGGDDPAAALVSANNALCENNDADMFVTAFLGCLNLRTGNFTYANAGHNPPIVIRGTTGGAKTPEISWLDVSPGFVLGGMPKIAYDRGELKLARGDSLLLYTDGVTEALSSTQERYGEPRLRSAVQATYGLGVADQCELIRADVDDFVHGAEPVDDLTMLLVRYDGMAATRNDVQPKPEAKLNELVVPANVDQLNAVQEFISTTLSAANCEPEITAQVHLAAEEIFVNIAHYAYEPGAIEPTVTVRCGVAAPNPGVVLEFADGGREFNPLAATPEPDLTSPAADRNEGGLGIFLAQQLMSSMDYRRDGNLNVLTMTRSLSSGHQ